MNRIVRILYSKSLGATVLMMKDGTNYCLPAVRDPVLIAQFCAKARKDEWTIAFNAEGMRRLMASADLESQEMSF